MKIITEVRRTLTWVRIWAAFYSKGICFPIVKLFDLKAARQNSGSQALQLHSIASMRKLVEEIIGTLI